MAIAGSPGTPSSLVRVQPDGQAHLTGITQNAPAHLVDTPHKAALILLTGGIARIDVRYPGLGAVRQEMERIRQRTQ